jgi:probable rRNA maturation factor
MISTDITNLTSLQINENKIKKIVEKVIKSEGIDKEDKSRMVSVVFLGPRGIKKINKQYRGKNRVTDVLSFNFQQDKEVIYDNLKNEQSIAAEIFICLKEIRKNIIKEKKILAKNGAPLKRCFTSYKNFNLIFGQEVINVLIHGLLHCFGYDHHNEQQFKKMLKRQEKILSLFTREDKDIIIKSKIKNRK